MTGSFLLMVMQSETKFPFLFNFLYQRVGRGEDVLPENIHGQCSIELYPSILLPLLLSNRAAVCSTRKFSLGGKQHHRPSSFT